MIEGLQQMEKVERLLESVEFLCNQKNVLAASIEFKKLKSLVLAQSETRQFLTEYGAFDGIQKRVIEKQRSISDQIIENIQELIYCSNMERCKSKLQMISGILSTALTQIDGDKEFVDHICRDHHEIARVQDSLKKMINQDNDDALRVYDIIGSYLDGEQHHSDSLNSGLIFLQKESNLSIATQNIPYLVILCVAYSNISDTTIQEELRKQLDQQFQALVQRLVNVLIQERLQIKKSFQNGIFSQNKDSKLLNEFLQISDNDLRSVTIQSEAQQDYYRIHDTIYYVRRTWLTTKQFLSTLNQVINKI